MGATAAKIDSKYLRVAKGLKNQRMHNESFPCNDELKCEIYEKATVLPVRKDPADMLLFGKGGVVDKDGNYIELSGLPNRCEGGYTFQADRIYSETVVYCGYFCRHWGHFLIESVARLWYALKEEAKNVDSFVFVVEEGQEVTFHKNYKEFLELLGIFSRVKIINKPSQFDKVIVPELAYKRTIGYSTWYNKIFDVVISNLPECTNLEPASRIYFTRSGLSKAGCNEFGHKYLDDFFSRNGYKLLMPERLKLHEMIWYIQHADVCACPSGTPPHNMLFAREGQKVLIMEKTCVVNEIQVDINRIKKLDVTYIDSNINILPVDMGGGPFILCYNNLLDRFAAENGYIRMTDIVKKPYRVSKLLKAYFKSWGEINRNYPPEWIWKGYMDEYVESYKDAVEQYHVLIPESRKKNILEYMRFCLMCVKNKIKRKIFE